MLARRRLGALFVVVSCVVVSCGALALGDDVGAQAPEAPGADVAVHDPSGRALRAFHGALARGERTRVLVWGASHVSEDGITAPLRVALQGRYGDAGPGLVMPARPFPLYAHARVAIAEADRWRGLRVSGRSARRDAFGPAGFAIEAREPARAFVAPSARVDSARVFYLAQPGGGRLTLSVDGAPPRELSTRGRRAARSERVAPDGGLTRLDLVARGDGPVRLFGVSLERDAPGVIVDALGAPGARMGDRLAWDDEVMRAPLAALRPDLVVLSYGTNESAPGRPIAAYRAELDEALRRARALVPRASCLILGPSDWPARDRRGAFIARARAAEVIAAQREAAARHGCGHLDLVALMGGPLSMLRWVEAGLGASDHVHFTPEGHRVVGARIARAILPR